MSKTEDKFNEAATAFTKAAYTYDTTIPDPSGIPRPRTDAVREVMPPQLRLSALDLIQAIQDYMRSAGPGGIGDDLDDAVLRTFAQAIGKLRAAGLELPWFSGLPAEGMRKRRTPIELTSMAKSDEHLEALEAAMDVGLGEAIRKSTQRGLNAQHQYEPSASAETFKQAWESIETPMANPYSPLRKSDEKRKPTSFSDITGTP